MINGRIVEQSYQNKPIRIVYPDGSSDTLEYKPIKPVQWVGIGEYEKAIKEAHSSGWEIESSIPVIENGNTKSIIFIFRRRLLFFN